MNCFNFCRFHLLSDFNKSKWSCRWKLEIHNGRRRRKPHYSFKVVVDKDSKGDLQMEETACDDEARKGVFFLFLMKIQKKRKYNF